MQGWGGVGGSCRVGVGVGHVGVRWGVSYRGGVGWVMSGFEGMCMSNEKFLKPS